MLADFHVHSGFSDDSVYPPEKVVQDAYRLNLDVLCFTEHVDYGVKPDWDNTSTCRFEDGRPVVNVAYPAYFAEIERLRKYFAGKIDVRCGLELGVQMVTLEENTALMQRYWDQLDFVLMSIHQINNIEFWMGNYPNQQDQMSFNMAYWEEMLKVVQAYKRYDCLSHLDLIARYDPHGEWSFANIKDIVAEIMKVAIADAKAIEVNTSGIRYGLGHFHPTREMLALWRDLGGSYITIGSDSHKPEHLASYIAPAKRELKELGFRHFYTYKHHEPCAHSLA